MNRRTIEKCGKILVMALVIVPSLMLFSGCAGQSEGSRKNQSGENRQISSITESAVSADAIDESEEELEKNALMNIQVTGNKRVNIPNPKETEGQVEISLYGEKTPDLIQDKEEIEEHEEEEEQEDFSKLITDLSFAGLANKMLVTSYAVGYMAERDESYACIRDSADDIRVKKAAGNSLALFVTECSKEIENRDVDEIDWTQEDCYLLILDYANHTYYCTKSKEFFLHDIDYWNDMNFVDLTGDGAEELVVCHNYNKSIAYTVYYLDADSGKISVITDDEDAYRVEEKNFSAKLKDNYKVTLSVEGTDFEKTVSIPEEVSYINEDMLEEGTKALVDGDEDGWIGKAFKVWKNGKLRGSFEIDTYTNDMISFDLSDSGELNRLRVKTPIMMVHRSEYLGYLYLYYKYDKKTGKMRLDDADFVGYSKEKPDLLDITDTGFEEMFRKQVTEEEWKQLKKYLSYFNEDKGCEKLILSYEPEIDNDSTLSTLRRTVKKVIPDCSIRDVCSELAVRIENHGWSGQGDDGDEVVLEKIQLADVFGTGKKDLILTLRTYDTFGTLFRVILHRDGEKCYLVTPEYSGIEFAKTKEGEVVYGVRDRVSSRGGYFLWIRMTFSKKEIDEKFVNVESFDLIKGYEAERE